MSLYKIYIHLRTGALGDFLGKAGPESVGVRRTKQSSNPSLWETIRHLEAEDPQANPQVAQTSPAFFEMALERESVEPTQLTFHRVVTVVIA